MHRILPAPGEVSAARAAFDRQVRDADADIRAEPARDVLGQSPVPAELAAGRLSLHFGSAQVFPDPPSKAVAALVPQQPSAAMRGQLEAIANAQSDVAISSPYFIPSEFGMRVMTDARRRGIQVLVLTNSLGSTDESLAHAAYARYRPELLRLGVELYELGPTLARDAGGFGRFGGSIARLHAKLAVVDRRWLLVGSVNLDSRSALFNTELGVAIDCPPVAIAALRVVAGDAFRSMYRLRLGDDGQRIEWVAIDAEGQLVVTPQEPQSDWALRLRLWMQSLFVGRGAAVTRCRAAAAQAGAEPMTHTPHPWSIGRRGLACLLSLMALLLPADAVQAERHALLVGVSRYASFADDERMQLSGPRNDVQLLRTLLEPLGFAPQAVRVLADGVPGSAEPTRAAILVVAGSAGRAQPAGGLRVPVLRRPRLADAC